MKPIMIFICSAAMAGCMPEAPAMPSFQQDVMPILAANCLRCHAAPVIGGAPEVFRLDRFGPTTLRAGLPSSDPICFAAPDDVRCEILMPGAASYASIAAIRVASDDRPMPPRFPIDDHQIETLENWSDLGAQRGEPRPGNRAPEAALVANVRTDSQYDLMVRVDDADRDVVGGSLHAQIAGTETFVGLLSSGVAQISWDAQGIPAGSYPLSAHLDDGAAVVVVDVGTITVGGP